MKIWKNTVSAKRIKDRDLGNTTLHTRRQKNEGPEAEDRPVEVRGREYLEKEEQCKCHLMKRFKSDGRI